jgi:hypothetical protein
MYNKKNCCHRSANNSRNHYNSNTVINLVNIIYDDEFVSLINNLSSSLKDYFKLLNKLLNNIREIISTLSNQTLYSKCLLNECFSIDKNIYMDKLMQLSDRIDIIDNNKKLLDNNISLIDANMSSFLDKAKILFKKMKITRNSKINKTMNNQRILQNNININNRNILDLYRSKKNLNCNNYNCNENSKKRLNNKNYRSCNNKNNKNPIINDNPNFRYSSLKKNKSKSYSNNFQNNNLLINDDYSYNYNNKIKNDYNHFNDINYTKERQKTISFNLRQFLFKNNKVDSFLEKSNESIPIKNSSLKKMKNNNNSLINYCSLIDISKTKNNRNLNLKEGINNKNISTFNNDASSQNSNFNIKLNNKMELDKKKIYNFKKCWNNANLDLKSYSHKNIDYNNNLYNSLNYINKESTINYDMNKSQNNIQLNLANSVIEYFMFLKNINNKDENNTDKIKKAEKKLIDLSLNIINNYKNDNTSNLILTDSIKPKNNRINDLKNHFIRFSNRNKRIQNNNCFNKERRNINLSKNKNNNNGNTNTSNLNNAQKKEKIFRNSEELKIYNSVGNLMRQNIINNRIINGNNNNNGNNEKIMLDYKNNIIDILNQELRKKNEYIKEMNNTLFNQNKNKKNFFNNLQIITTNKIQIITKIKKNHNKINNLLIIRKEILLYYKGQEKILNKINININEKRNDSYNNEKNSIKYINENKNLKEENEKLKKEIKNLNENLAKLNEEIINVKNNELKKDNIDNEKNATILSLKEKNSNLNNELEDLKRKMNNDGNKLYKYKYELMREENNNAKNRINELNEEINEKINENKKLTNKLDEISFKYKSLEQEKNILEIKFKKIQEEKNELNEKLINGDKSKEKKIIVTDSDLCQQDEEMSEIYLNDDQSISNRNYEYKNLVENNKKLQETINQLQLELNNKILNDDNSRNNTNNRAINNITKSNENLEEIRKELKMKEDMIEQLQQKLNNIDNKINKIYNHKDYIILCDKYFKNLQWFLLTPKIKEKNNKKNNINDKNKNKINNNNNNIYTYENVFWVTKKNIEKEMSKYNDYVKENEEENKIIINYIKKLEEKENVISKLNLRLASLEKNINNKTSNNDKDKDLSKNRSRSSNNKPYTEIKYFEKEEKLSEDFKFTDKIDDCFNKGTTHGSGDDEKKYNNIEDELKANKKQIQLYEKVLEEFKNKIDKIKEFCNNYFSKTIITKYEKEDVRAILLLLDFNENDINFIINKKRK